jgi:hypothetical protein
MRLSADETLERFDDEVLRVSTLEDLDNELIDECISEQISNPFFSRSNFLEEFKENYDEEMDEANGDGDELNRLRLIANNFYFKVIYMIEKKFELDIDHDVVESLTGDAIRNIAEGLYEFFIVNYVDNISYYLSSRVIDYKDNIVEYLKDEKTMNNPIMNSIFNRIPDKTYALLLGNINRSINIVKDIEITPEEFIAIFNEEEFGTAIVRYAITNGIICGDFTKAFLRPTLGHTQDDMYDMVALNVQQAVYRDYRKSIRSKAGEN